MCVCMRACGFVYVNMTEYWNEYWLSGQRLTGYLISQLCDSQTEKN